MTSASKVHPTLLRTRRRRLYAERKKLAQVIQALEQLQGLQASRPEPAVLALLAANGHLCGRQNRAQKNLAA